MLNQPPACRIGEQIAIAEAEERARSTPTSATPSCGSRQRAQQHGQRSHFPGLAERAGAADLDRNLQRLERVRVGAEAVLPLSREDQESL